MPQSRTMSYLSSLHFLFLNHLLISFTTDTCVKHLETWH